MFSPALFPPSIEPLVRRFEELRPEQAVEETVEPEPAQPEAVEPEPAPPSELAGLPSVPGSLTEALDALRADHEFLLQGGVFSQELIDAWIDCKIEHEVDPVRLRPHPHEFNLYYDI